MSENDTNNIYDELATEIIFELSDESLNQAQVSEWLKYNLSALNLHLLKDFTEEELEEDEDAQIVFKTMYFCKYYNSMVRKALDGAITASGASSVLSLKDGNSSVTFQNKNEVSKSYKNLYDSTKNSLDELILAYRMKSSSPYQVVQSSSIPPTLDALDYSR